MHVRRNWEKISGHRPLVRKVKALLVQGKTSVVTDHLSLKRPMSPKDLREKLDRWVAEIQDYNFVTEHINGLELVVPDILSRDAVRKPLYQRR